MDYDTLREARVKQMSMLTFTCLYFSQETRAVAQARFAVLKLTRMRVRLECRVNHQRAHGRRASGYAAVCRDTYIRACKCVFRGWQTRLCGDISTRGGEALHVLCRAGRGCGLCLLNTLRPRRCGQSRRVCRCGARTQRGCWGWTCRACTVVTSMCSDIGDTRLTAP